MESEGRLLALGPPKQRALLALLLLRANRVVSRTELIDALWGERPPETAVSALQGYIAALRKLLGTSRIETRTTGYRLVADGEEIDVARFDRLVAEAWALEPEESSQRCAAALALWRDTPLAELDSAPFVEGERRRLEEARLAAIERSYEASLALGRHAEIVGELAALVAEHPLRERLRGELMLALYRSGRPSEALDAYRAGRHLLAGEFGLEPGEPLRRLERAILEQDPGIDLPLAPPPPPVATDAVPGRPASPAHASRGRRLLLVAAACALAALAILAGGLLVTRDGAKAVTVAAHSIAIIDPAANRVVGDIPVAGRPVAIETGAGGVWVASAGAGAVEHIDPRTRTVVATIRLGTDVTSLAVGEGAVWVANGNDGTITRIDPQTNRVKDTLFEGPADPLAPKPVFWIAAGDGAVWATRGDRLLRIDPVTDRVVGSRRIPNPLGLAVGLSSVWLTSVDERLLRISPDRPSESSALELPAQTVAPALGDGAVWLIVYQLRTAVWQVDPVALVSSATSGSSVLPSSAKPLQLAIGAGAVWSIDDRGVVVRFDPGDLRVVARIATGASGAAIAAGAGAIWVAVP